MEGKVLEVKFVLEVLEVKFGHLSSVFCEWAMPAAKTGPSTANRPGSEHQNTSRVSLEDKFTLKQVRIFLVTSARPSSSVRRSIKQQKSPDTILITPKRLKNHCSNVG